jgi:hypothetical protein
MSKEGRTYKLENLSLLPTLILRSKGVETLHDSKFLVRYSIFIPDLRYAVKLALMESRGWELGIDF